MSQRSPALAPTLALSPTLALPPALTLTLALKPMPAPTLCPRTSVRKLPKTSSEARAALERGDLTEAAAALERASTFDSNNPDVAELQERILAAQPDAG